MKQLYIMRHARAVSALHTPMNDFDRPLSHEGENDASHIGNIEIQRTVRVENLFLRSGHVTAFL